MDGRTDVYLTDFQATKVFMSGETGAISVSTGVAIVILTLDCVNGLA
jgi:hypothetical protein